MVKKTEAWEASDKSLHDTKERAKAAELNHLFNPGRVGGLSPSDTFWWIVNNWQEVKKVMEQ